MCLLYLGEVADNRRRTVNLFINNIFSLMIRQPFHLVEYSPWPLVGSFGAFSLTIRIVGIFYGFSYIPLLLGLIVILLTIFLWWRDVTRERTFMGFHTYRVRIGLRWGIILFITSEVLFFFAFFWSFFHRRLAPRVELGCSWPPTGIYPLDAFTTPLLNTGVLLGSGVRVTWAHHSLMESDYKNRLDGLSLTVLLGVYFTYLQAGEYLETSFSIADRSYGTTFFVATGFHGLHVLIGSRFLLICLIRSYYYHFSFRHHFGFEAAAWYWHFVDVVWIFLYLCVYWWGS